ncbi:MAG: AAA family ATPase [Cyanobacteria bacterium J06648_11]
MGTDSGTSPPNGFSVTQVGAVDSSATSHGWLVESLWAAQAVGIVGGTPKTGKTWAVLELALAVASGVKALGRFAVPDPGPVLFYPAEDRAADIRRRAELLCQPRGLALEELGLYILESDRLHLDDDADAAQLEEALNTLRPKLLVLDPLVRLHAGSENSTDHVSRVLGYLRELQRKFGVAIMLTHHLSKKGKGASVQHGQALRGSGDLHAWGDSNLYLTRLDGGVVELVTEHRQAQPLEEPVCYQLKVSDDGAGLAVLEEADLVQLESTQELRPAARASRLPQRRVRQPVEPLEQRILSVLKEHGPLSGAELRPVLGVRNQSLRAALREMAATDAIVRVGQQWAAVDRPSR